MTNHIKPGRSRSTRNKQSSTHNLLQILSFSRQMSILLLQSLWTMQNLAAFQKIFWNPKSFRPEPNVKQTKAMQNHIRACSFKLNKATRRRANKVLTQNKQIKNNTTVGLNCNKSQTVNLNRNMLFLLRLRAITNQNSSLTADHMKKRIE